MASADKLTYVVTSINQYQDQGDMIAGDGGVQRPKRKIEVTIAPKEAGTGVFASMNIQGVVQNYQSPRPSEQKIIFEEVAGPFPWQVGSELELSLKSA